jgi:ubiquinone/menaquinone biosynthesis C-methylase UbiE
VFCVDVEARMLRSLGHRLERRGLEGRVALRQCGTASLEIDELAGRIDCAVLIHVLHEIPDPRTALREIASALKPQGRLVLIEPPGHVSRQQFEAELAIAGEVGLTRIESATRAFGRRYAAVLERVR